MGFLTVIMGARFDICKLTILAFIYSRIQTGQNAVAQEYTSQDTNITFCTTSKEEQNKCYDLSTLRDVLYKINCKKGASKEDCMMLLDQGEADLTTLDPGHVFTGGRYHSLVPIAQEIYDAGETHYYSVAAVKRGSLPDVKTISDLKGKKACFAGVGTLAGWTIPIYQLMKHGGMSIYDCNNHVKSAMQFFGPSCAVNSLMDRYNPLGDNSDKLCQLCGGTAAGDKCTPNDPYYGYEGAFKCLIEKGDVAFLKHATIGEVMKRPIGLGVTKSVNDFELLCPDGTRRPINDYKNCNWGRAPSQAVVTSSAKTSDERTFYQKFIKDLSDMYSKSSFSNSTNGYNHNEQFHLFESVPRYGYKRNLLFQDDSTGMKALEERYQTYAEFLGDSMEHILGVGDCPIERMTLCITSEVELEKCVKMKSAIKAKLLKPELMCYKGFSQVNCMQAIKNGFADVAVFDAGDVYAAGYNYNLIPFMSETYNLDSPEYYVVAVTKEEDPDTELTHLYGKYTCHTGINMAAGWVIPLAFIISNGWIRSYGCDSVRAAAEYFSKSCVPGAISAEYNAGVPYDNMCDLCHGATFRYCRRDANEDYFGHTGAFRCLVEGGGQVAFVKHTTILENTDGRRKDYWARNTFSNEFQLLCPNGTRGNVNGFRNCSLGKVKANAIVTRGGSAYNETEINAYINLFLYTQQYFGSKNVDDFSFSMFSSRAPYSDLIFQDATRQLLVIPPSQRYYSEYLGKDFMRAKRIVDCTASPTLSPS